MSTNGNTPDFSNWLVPPERVPADEMPWPVEVKVNGKLQEKVLYPQKGRSIWIVRSKSSGLDLASANLFVLMSQIEKLQAEAEALEEDDTESPRYLELVRKLGELSEAAVAESNAVMKILVGAVADWDLIGLDGELLEKPHRNMRAFDPIPLPGTNWIGSIVRGGTGTPGESEEERGKGGKSSRSPGKGTRGRPSNSSSRGTAVVTP